MRQLGLLLPAGALLLSAPPASAAGGGGFEPLSDSTAVRGEVVRLEDGWGDGKHVRMALVLKHEPGWHTYWVYPGDSGLATSIAWELPDGVRAGEFEWPTPRKLDAMGLVSYVYEGELVLPFVLELPGELPASGLKLKGKVSWLRCTEIACEPGGMEFELALGADAAAHPDAKRWKVQIEASRPRKLPDDARIGWTREGLTFQLRVNSGGSIGEVRDFFPNPPQGVVIEKVEGPFPDPGDAANAGAIQFRIVTAAAPEGITQMAGLLIAGTPSAGFVIGDAESAAAADSQPAGTTATIGGSEKPASPEPAGTEHASFDTLGTGRVTSLWQAILFGILGGLILNLMPCVLPAISLKIVGFVQQAGESRRQILLHGLSFTAGIYAWFAAIALAFIGVRMAGGELNWAFQFQNPWMVFAMGAVLVTFALNLFGLFEIILPSKAATAVDRAGQSQGLWGSFLHGVFATILATPCTAPFLGSALGFALAQPTWVIPVIFLSIATGMALPYLLLAARPGWVRYLPKPGGWMVRLKEFMGFPLLATVLWLIWLLGQMRGPDAATSALGFYLLLGLVTWLWGAFFHFGTTKRTRFFGAISLALTFALAAWAWPILGATFAERPQSVKPTPDSGRTETGHASNGVIHWEPFSNKRLAELLDSTDRPIFIDFTADWCWTCKVNEQVVLSRREVIDAFETGQFVMVKADFTNFDPEIKQRLMEFERGGVPMYVVYPRDRAKKPVLLPEVITPEIVIEAARQAAQKQ